MTTGWTSSRIAHHTDYGTIYYGGPCRTERTWRYDQGGGHTIFWLQPPAMKAYLDAQYTFAHRQGWSNARIDKTRTKINGKWWVEGKPIIVLAGTNRTCATQASLYRSDTSRYAPPQYTGHTRGLAVDIDQRQPGLGDIYAALTAHEWFRSRPTDEPWHWTFHVKV